MTDKTFEKEGVILEYDDTKEAIAIVSDFKLFIKEFPSKKYLFENKLYTDGPSLNIKDIKPKTSNIQKYIDLYKKSEILENLLEIISIDRQEDNGRSYAYELFYSKKTIVSTKLDYTHLKKITPQLVNNVSNFLSMLSTNSSHLELNKKFILKAIEIIFKDKKTIELNDLIDKWQDICEEFEILQRAYIENLDTQKLKFDYEKKIQELNDQLYNVLNNIQNKIILPPLAIMILAINISNKPYNIQILAMISLFMFLSIISIYSCLQLQFLNNHKNIITKWQQFYEKNLNKNFYTLKQRFNKLFDLLNYINITIKISNLLIWSSYFLIFIIIF